MLRKLIIGLSMFFLFSAGNTFGGIMVYMPKSVKQGGVIKVVIKIGVGDQYNGKIVFFNQSDNSLRREFIALPTENLNEYLGLIPIGVDETPGYDNVCAANQQYGICSPIEIEKVDFPESKRIFSVTKPTLAVSARFKKERTLLDDIYARVTLKKYLRENFQFTGPLEKMGIIQNANFGQIRKKILINPKTRKIEDRWKDYHKGVDLRAWVGEPVYAAEDGKVVVARNLLGSGNTVIIDHGYGLISLYFHLSKIYLKEGDDVHREEWIGLAGMSGNAEGPHLHFEIRLYGIAVSPWGFMQEPQMFEQKAVSTPAPKKRGAK